MRKIFFILLVLVACLTSCVHNEKEQAKNMLARANTLYISNSFNSAKILIDSIHNTYPRLIEVRKEASKLMNMIELKEHKRNLAYYDSVFAVITPIYDSISANFIVTDTTYSSKKVLIHKKRGKNYFPKTNLLAEVLENGDINLISVYNGKSISHDSIKIYYQDFYSNTSKVPSSKKYSFTDLGTTWEYVTFEQQYQNDILSFVDLYKDKLLIVNLYGDRSYDYFLAAEDKAILSETLFFAKVKKEIYTLNKNINNTKNKIKWLEEKSY